MAEVEEGVVALEIEHVLMVAEGKILCTLPCIDDH